MNKLSHVAIIMDGNGRWGLKKKGSRNYGHLQGIKTVETVIKSSLVKRIPYLTLYTFSTENWKRPDNEINFLFDLIRKSLKKKLKKIINQGIKVNIIGQKKGLPKDIIKIVKIIEKKTLKNTPDPDILIRTGGTKRLSNFLLWQLAYTEIFFIDKLWPEFAEKDFNKIVSKFYSIKRNFGKI